MKKTLLFLALFALASSAWAQEKIRLSLEDAVSSALVNNYGQQVLEISKLSSSEDLSQSKRDLLPDLNASLSQGLSNKNNSGNYSISASATLWKAGQGVSAIRRAQIALNQTDTKIAQAQNDLTIQVMQAFLSVLMNEELYKYQSSVALINKQQMEQGEIKFKSGQILESDYLLLKSQYTTGNYSLVNSRVNRDNAIVELKTLLSLTPSIEIEIVTPTDFSLEELGLPTLEELIQQTMSWLPDVKIATQNIDLALVDTKIAKAELFPTLSLSGSVGTNYNNISGNSWANQFTGNNTNQISLSLSVPLWNKGKAQSSIRQSKYQLEQAQLEAKQTELSIQYKLETEYSNVVSLREKYLSAQESNDAYRQTFNVFSTQFDAGSVSTTELLQQQNNYLSALNDFVISKYNYLLNRKVLDVYMGNEIKI